VLGAPCDPLHEPEAQLLGGRERATRFRRGAPAPASCQHADLILREVVGSSAAEVAALLGKAAAPVNSALRRARATPDGRIPSRRRRPRAADELVLAVHRRAGDTRGAETPPCRDASCTRPPLRGDLLPLT
jgi:hypothetical protein